MEKRLKQALRIFGIVTIILFASGFFLVQSLHPQEEEIKMVILGVTGLLIGVSALTIMGVTRFFIEVDKDRKEGIQMEKTILGTEVAKERRSALSAEIETLKQEGQRVPHLVVILVGDNPASLSYIKGKEKACTEVGMKSTLIQLEASTTQEELKKIVQQQSQDELVDGILIQLPLPKHFNEKEIIAVLDPKKDVDGLHPMNMGNLLLNEDGFIPCTPLGIMALIHQTGISIQGKRAVVLGRSPLVGNSVAQLLMRENATVTICHSKTVDLEARCKEADILVVAIGRPKMVTKDYIKKGAVVIDVGINRTEEGKLVGDVDFENVFEEASFITPVPKGVGPMTITMLLENTMKAYRVKR